MPIRFGPIDPLQLTFNIVNALIKNGVISSDDAKQLIKESMDPNLSDDEKEKVLNSLIKK